MDYPFLTIAFPDFPVGEVPLPLQNAAEWEDVSYGNDTCPSFQHRKAPGLQMWINRLNPADRDEGEEAPRFNLGYDRDGGADVCWIYSGNDQDEAMNMVKSFLKGMGL